jgi:hypothetical protein
MPETIPREELSKLPFVRHIPTDGRIVSLQSYYDHATGSWHLYVPVRQGELGRIAGGKPVSGSYFSTGAADPTCDLELPLGTLITQHLSFPDVIREFNKLESDIHRCAAILEKYHLLSSRRYDTRSESSLLVISELEYLLLLLRSLYDLLQGVVRQVSKLLIHLDGTQRRVVQDLPTSFADVALAGQSVRPAEEIQSRWGVPKPLALWYHSEAPFFRELRDLRDGIAHHGRNLPFVVVTEWGFGIDPATQPWNRFDIWPQGQRWDGRLGSLRAIFTGFVVHSIQATSRFASVVRASVRLPPAIADDVCFFIRSPFGKWLVGLEVMMEQPWEGLNGESAAKTSPAG